MAPNPSEGGTDMYHEYSEVWHGERSVYSSNTVARALVGNAPEGSKSGVWNRTLDTQSKRSCVQYPTGNAAAAFPFYMSKNSRRPATSVCAAAVTANRWPSRTARRRKKMGARWRMDSGSRKSASPRPRSMIPSR